MLNRLIILLILVFLCGGSGFLGFKFGAKELFNSTPDDITYDDSKVSFLTSLSGIKIRPILGPRGTTNKLDENKANHRGSLIYKVNETDTEIKILAQDLPLSNTIAEDRQRQTPSVTVDLPNRLRIEIAKPNPVSSDYDFKELAVMNLNPPEDGFYTGEINTSLPNSNNESFTDFDLVLFYDAENKVTNVFEFNIDGYANIPEAKRRPFFWAYINDGPTPGT
jgi:hypothetical protein